MKKLTLHLVMALFAMTTFLQVASATKTAAPLPIQLNVNQMMTTLGGTVQYTMTIPNATSTSYWGVTATVNFPAEVNCTGIVSQAGGCTLTGNRLSCYWADVYGHQTKTAVVSCTVKGDATCSSNPNAVANINVMKPTTQNNAANATFLVKCPPATATPTSTSTSTPVITSTPVVIASSTPTTVPTATSTPVYNTPTPICTASPTPTPVCTVSPTPTATKTPTPGCECNDGIDNDGDGKVDFPYDPGCTDANDGTEGASTIQITQTISSTVQSGGQATYEFKLKNVGTQTISSVRMLSVFIDPTTGARLSPVFAWTTSGGTITNCQVIPSELAVFCPVTNFAPGTERVYTLTYQVPTTSTLCNTLVVNETEAVADNGSDAKAKASTTVLCGSTVPTATPTVVATSTPVVVGPTPTATPSGQCQTYSVLRRVQGQISARNPVVSLRESVTILPQGQQLACLSTLLAQKTAPCLTYGELRNCPDAAVQSDLQSLSAGGTCFGLSQLTYSILGQSCTIDEDSDECEQFLALNTFRSNDLPVGKGTAGVCIGRAHNPRIQLFVFDANCRLILNPTPEQEDNSCAAATVTTTLWSYSGRKGRRN